MQKEVTISIDGELYSGLMKSVGKKNVSRFIESVVRSYLENDSSQTYDVKLPILADNQTFKIHSPRLADRTLADRFKMEMFEETENGKL